METGEKRAFKNGIYEQLARIGKAVSNPHRLELLDVLAQGERRVELLAQETHLTVANTSQHLQVLRAAHLVEVRRDGVSIYYRLASPSVYRLWGALRDAGQSQLAEIDRLVDLYLRERKAFAPISREELQARLSDGDTIVLDVRPALEYRHGHITGARSIPVDELEKRLEELDPQRDIVAYCRGVYCVFADEAVSLLRARGLHAYRYAEGFPDWAAADLPITRDDTAQPISANTNAPTTAG